MTVNQRGGKVDLVQQGGRDIVSSPIQLSLPMPPSVNEMFRNVRGVGRVRSKVYEDWLGHAGWRLRAQRPGMILGRVIIVMSAEQAGLTSDIDNRVKATLDLLVAHQVIEDDRFVVGFCTAWAPPANRIMRVMVLPAASMTFKFHLAPDGAHGGWMLSAPQEDEDNGDFPEFTQTDVG